MSGARLSGAPKTRAAYPWARSIRGLPMKSAATPFRAASARTPIPGASARTTVPATSGRNVFRTTTGIPRATAGRIVAGWRTFAPKKASMAAPNGQRGQAAHRR